MNLLNDNDPFLHIFDAAIIHRNYISRSPFSTYCKYSTKKNFKMLNNNADYIMYTFLDI